MKESSLERTLVRRVREAGGMALKWVSPGNGGVPDRIVILPDGKTVYVEMKAPGKPLEPLQVRWAKILRSKGHSVYRIDSVEGIRAFIAEVMPK